MILLGIRVFADVIKLKSSRVDHPRLVWSLNSVTVFRKEAEKEKSPRDQGKKRSCEDRSRDWSDVSIS